MNDQFTTVIATTLTTSDRQGYSAKTSPLTRKCRYIIAEVLSWDSPREISSDEIETIAIADNILCVKLTNNRAVHIHVDVFRGIRQQQLEELALAEADRDLENVLRQSRVNSERSGQNSEHFSPLYTNIRIESDNKRHPVYTVWSGQDFLGSFHQSLVDGKWLTNSMYCRDYCRHETQKEAVAAIAAASTALPMRG